MTRIKQQWKRTQLLRPRATMSPLAISAALFVLFAVVTSSAQAQTLTVLYTFTGGADGNQPLAKLVRDTAGNLYSTTLNGGASGNGVVFKLDTTGNETVLHNFTGGVDGGLPRADLILAGGSLYGTASSGGTAVGSGVAFKMSLSGQETVLHTFINDGDGSSPVGGLVRDSLGTVYGTTCCSGPSIGGNVFKIDTHRRFTSLHSFNAAPDGLHAVADLVRDASGNLYGTTPVGGSSGSGTVFKVDAAGNETVLYNFTGLADGANPQAGLVRDGAGNLYGTTSAGGTSGNGVVFKLTPAGKQTVLLSFPGGVNGANPYASLLRDAAGNLYGTTSAGGTFDSGTIFKLDKTDKETVLYSFTGGNDGSCPMAGLIQDKAGNFYGTTAWGGASGVGVVFKF